MLQTVAPLQGTWHINIIIDHLLLRMLWPLCKSLTFFATWLLNVLALLELWQPRQSRVSSLRRKSQMLLTLTKRHCVVWQPMPSLTVVSFIQHSRRDHARIQTQVHNKFIAFKALKLRSNKTNPPWIQTLTAKWDFRQYGLWQEARQTFVQNREHKTSSFFLHHTH